MSIPSPCLNLCSMGGDGYCEGCLRTIEEIATWGTLSDEEQLHIITEVIPERDYAQKSQ